MYRIGPDWFCIMMLFVVGGLDIQVDGSIVEGEFYCYSAANSIISCRKAMLKRKNLCKITATAHVCSLQQNCYQASASWAHTSSELLRKSYLRHSWWGYVAYDCTWGFNVWNEWGRSWRTALGLWRSKSENPIRSLRGNMETYDMKHLHIAVFLESLCCFQRFSRDLIWNSCTRRPCNL